MKEIIRISLDNEMDLILAHKRSIKLAELCSLLASSQTRFATAVSEIARCAIASGQESYLILGIDSLNGGKKEIVAVLYDKVDLAGCNPEAFFYAKKVLKDVSAHCEDDIYTITLRAKVPYSGLLSEKWVNSFVDYFRQEPPISPYDEIRKKNIQLIELADRLSESENDYRQLTDTLPFIVFSVSKSEKVFVANKNAENILGSNFKEFSAATIQQIIHAQDTEQVIKAWNSAKKKQTVQTVQARVISTKEPIWYQISLVPHNDERTAGWIISMVNIHAQKLVEETLKDNNELKEAKEKLRQSNDELQKKNKELEQFAYIASHDLQEPLRKIRNFISLAQHNRSDIDKQNLYYSKINASAERMSQLIIDVLSYSKLAVTSDTFEFTDLNSVLSDVINDFEFLLSEKKAVLTVEPMPSVLGKPVQLGQLFYNLISNSLKFSEETPVIHISHQVINDNGIALNKIVVSDNGIGIEPHHVDKLFTIFKRLHPQSAYPGTGIGLALCKKIVENHGGRIEIDSNSNGGTDVIVYLPYTAA
ncbi:ATP-binding protein [Arcicella aquatica]|uniref:histidine kinase n=1 Tax=Arcicella aquatica TaxID=217141 RepID=A0ABU5QSX0_9BACT|nr:ATP-binding protein [Arcicella aquatica]MEA5259491.1 ATP-binding protein [Arcicella aquatica]